MAPSTGSLGVDTVACTPVDDFQPLPPRALTMIRLRSATVLTLVALFVAAAVVSFVAGEPVLGAVSLIVSGATAAAWWVLCGLVYRSYRWKLTDETIELCRGYLVRRHIVLPRARVQNVTKSAGPVARAYGLVTVTVHSAGANTPNITLPDIGADTGEALRAGLLPSVRP